ncbi:hypothetical protein [Acetobacter fallax]|uniref:Transposase n=1 Tax=Acetobacter fallax TaxID=1737473 RepID=A0ABX0K8F6_9PROT|nr:hypothetical protein [Acetobacter fallax]NHO32680.1 hypothetical protein [Acetobacter fallax]NHO36260.1 hypothetical protein [Acetobacter fallax]
MTSWCTGGWYAWRNSEGKRVLLRYVAGDWSDEYGTLFDEAILQAQGWRIET